MVFSPNQYLQIFTSPLPIHSTNFVQYNDNEEDDNDFSIFINITNIQNHKGKTNILFDISFTYIDSSITTLDGLLYIKFAETRKGEYSLIPCT